MIGREMAVLNDRWSEHCKTAKDAVEPAPEPAVHPDPPAQTATVESAVEPEPAGSASASVSTLLTQADAKLFYQQSPSNLFENAF